MGAEILSLNFGKLLAGSLDTITTTFKSVCQLPTGFGAMVRAVAFGVSNSGSIPARSIGFSILGV